MTLKINQKRLVKIFKDTQRLKTEEMRFCFLIGAGASKSSGIQTGWEFSKEWYEDLKEDIDTDDLKQWEKRIEFDEERIGEFYPHLYRKRYEAAPQIAYEEFKSIMEKTEPGLGYVVLSQVLASEKHNFVIREVTRNNIPILLVFLSVFCVAIIDEYFNILPLSRLEYEQKFYVI